MLKELLQMSQGTPRTTIIINNNNDKEWLDRLKK
jgi:hypothetical protein